MKLLNNFVYDRYSSNRIIGNCPQVDLSQIIINELSLEEEFNILINELEHKNNKKYSQSKRREMFMNFKKMKKRK